MYTSFFDVDFDRMSKAGKELDWPTPTVFHRSMENSVDYFELKHTRTECSNNMLVYPFSKFRTQR